MDIEKVVPWFLYLYYSAYFSEAEAREGVKTKHCLKDDSYYDI